MRLNRQLKTFGTRPQVVFACTLCACLAISQLSQAAGRREVLPEGTVIPVRLDDSLSSKSSRRGDKFTATVRFGRDDAGLPEGTRVEGSVREAYASHNGKPGVIDVNFQRIVFPNGDRTQLTGSLTALNGKNLHRDSKGRLVDSGSKSKDRLKWVGIGAGAELQRPLAIAVIGGLSMSTLFTLILAPTLYSTLLRGRYRAGGSSERQAGIELD